MRRMTSDEIIRRLKSDGWTLEHVVGSHHKFRLESRTVTVPHPVKDFHPKTLKSIYKAAGWL